MGYGCSTVVDKEWNKTIMMNEVIANTKGCGREYIQGGSDHYREMT